MGSVIISDSLLTQLFSNAKATFLETQSKYKSPLPSDLVAVPPSTDMIEHYFVTGQSSNMKRLSEANKQTINPFLKAVTVQNGEPYAQFVSISRQDLELGKGIYSLAAQAQKQGYAVAAKRDIIIKEGLQAGTSTVWADGKNFFATDHPKNPLDPASATWSNYHVNTDLTRANWQLWHPVMSAQVGWENDGLPVMPPGMRPKVIVPSQLLYKAKSLFGQAQVVEAGATTDASASNINFGEADVIHFSLLDNQPKQWYVAYCGMGLFPIAVQEWRKPMFEDNNSMQSDLYRNEEKVQSKVSYGAEFVPLNAMFIHMFVEN